MLWMPYFECDDKYSKLVDLVEHAKFPIFVSLNQSVETEALAFEQILYFAAVICNCYKLIVLSHILYLYTLLIQDNDYMYRTVESRQTLQYFGFTSEHNVFSWRRVNAHALNPMVKMHL